MQEAKPAPRSPEETAKANLGHTCGQKSTILFVSSRLVRDRAEFFPLLA